MRCTEMVVVSTILRFNQAYADQEGKQWIQVIYPIDSQTGDSGLKLQPHSNWLIFSSQSDYFEKLAGQLYKNPPQVVYKIPFCYEKIQLSQYASDLKSKGVSFWGKNYRSYKNIQFEDPDSQRGKALSNSYHREITWLRENLKQARSR